MVIEAQKYQNGPNWDHWKKNDNASACFTEGGFEYGIYLKAVNLLQNLIFLQDMYIHHFGEFKYIFNMLFTI
jgi:hypothetical protein